MVSTFFTLKFRLKSLDYLSRRSVYFEFSLSVKPKLSNYILTEISGVSRLVVNNHYHTAITQCDKISPCIGVGLGC